MNSECRPPSFPARPVNGGPLEKALPKNGIWAYEPKINGWRAWLHTPTGVMFNRKNEPLSITRQFAPIIGRVKACSHVIPEWLDVEALERRLPIGKGSLVVLDTPLTGTWDERQEHLYLTLVQRGIAKSWAFEQFAPPENELLMFAYNYQDETAQLTFIAHNREQQTAIDRNLLPLAGWKRLQAVNKQLGCNIFEGLVAKRVESIYPIQRRSPDTAFPFWMKHRWTL